MLRRHDSDAVHCMAVINSVLEVMIQFGSFLPHHPLGFKAREIIGQYLQGRLCQSSSVCIIYL